MDDHKKDEMMSRRAVIDKLGPEALLKCLERMLLIRNFETRAEAAYLQGFVGGFFHSYIGQEAIQMAAVEAIGVENWYATSYRCHALALLLGATPKELMAELYGRATGNAQGRGGSMHFYTDRLLGGTGIVGGQVPLATGAAFAIKYRGIGNEVSVCFMGDGAVVQGAFHEALNLAALWKLPCVYVIENNLWGMGTAANRAVAVERIAEAKAPGYGMKGYTVDGTDFFACYALFDHVHAQMLKDSSPVLIEAIAERFKGHSVSDPGLYRSKDALKTSMGKDPIMQMKNALIEEKIIDEEAFKLMDKSMREVAIEALKYAEESPWPDVATLGLDVFAPNEE
jgi:pyruvate dehydrogenase E1 component alpha subunit